MFGFGREGRTLSGIKKVGNHLIFGWQESIASDKLGSQAARVCVTVCVCVCQCVCVCNSNLIGRGHNQGSVLHSRDHQSKLIVPFCKKSTLHMLGKTRGENLRQCGRGERASAMAGPLEKSLAISDFSKPSALPDSTFGRAERGPICTVCLTQCTHILGLTLTITSI